MIFRITTTAGQKLVLEAGAIEIEPGTGKLNLWEGLRGGKIVKSYDSTEWRGIEQWNGAPVPPCNCNH